MWVCNGAVNARAACMWFSRVNMVKVAPSALQFPLTIQSKINCVLNRVEFLTPVKTREQHVVNVTFSCCGWSLVSKFNVGWCSTKASIEHVEATGVSWWAYAFRSATSSHCFHYHGHFLTLAFKIYTYDLSQIWMTACYCNLKPCLWRKKEGFTCPH